MDNDFTLLDSKWMGLKYYDEDDRPVLLIALGNNDYIIRDRRGDWKYITRFVIDVYCENNNISLDNPGVLTDVMLDISYSCKRIEKGDKLPSVIWKDND